MPRGLKFALSSLLIGAMSLGLAYAGAVLTPPTGISDGVGSKASLQEAEATQEDTAAATDLAPPGTGLINAGAAKVSLYPRPEDYQEAFPGARWERDYDTCATLAPSQDALEQTAMHVADYRVKWAENPNCLYMGGYGIGPMFPITEWDNEYGLWVRSIAMQDAQKDTVILTLIDAVYWEAYYNSLCKGCGFLELANQLSAELGIPAKSFIFASTHSHTSMDFIGGWGAVPNWYMQQATDSLKEAVRQSVANMRPAVLEAGESFARPFNGERRDYYRSAEDNAMSWFRLVYADQQPQEEVCTITMPPTPSPEPANNGNGGGNGYGNAGKATPSPYPSPVETCQPAVPGRAIATVGAYPAHPVTEDHEGGEADADFPAVFAKTVEEAYDGVGMFLQTGLGNVSPRGNKITMGTGLASLVPAIGGGQTIANPDVAVGRRNWIQPVTNAPLGALGVGGFFDRKMNEAPATLTVGKGPDNTKCHSASPISVNTSVSAAKIGPLWITGGPGELFSGITNTIEERNPNGITMALGLVNDGLGYLIQSYETDYAGREGPGFVAGSVPVVGVAEYEDAYSIDHCIGDAALEYTLQLLGTL